MAIVLHLVALAGLSVAVWFPFASAAGRMPREEQVNLALWLLNSNESIPWSDCMRSNIRALVGERESIFSRLSVALAPAVLAIAATTATWAAVSTREFLAWLEMIRRYPDINLPLFIVPCAFCYLGVVAVNGKAHRLSESISGAQGTARNAVWLALDVALTVAFAMIGWLGFLAALWITGREQSFSHLLHRALAEVKVGWSTGLSMTADRNGWPTWGIYFYAIALVGVLPWLQTVAATLLRFAIRLMRPVVELVDRLGLIDLERAPLRTTGTIATGLMAALYAALAVVS